MTIEATYIDQLKTEETFVLIYTDDSDNSYIGFILDFNEDFLVLELYNDEGLDDGIAIILRETITRIRWSGNELTSIYKLINQLTRLVKVFNIDLTSIETVLQSVKELYGYVVVQLDRGGSSMCLIGEIMDMDEDTVVLHEYGTMKSLDRSRIMLSTTNILVIQGGGRYEQTIKGLFEE